MQLAKISAAVIAYHIPSTPKISGKNSTDEVWNKRVRKNEMAAEMPPLLRAVKNEDANMLNPANKNANEKSLKAWQVRLNSSLSYPTKMCASGELSRRADAVRAIPEKIISSVLILSRFLSSA